jgi:hypothetical protein
MDDRLSVEVEDRLRKTAAEFSYPPLPDISGKVLTRLKLAHAKRPLHMQKLAWVLVVLIVMTAGLLVAPPVRAQILEFLQVGVVRIFLGEPGEMLPPTQPLDLPSPSTALIPSLQTIAGETDLQNARAQVPFPIQLPGYPEDLGQPNRVFLQDMAGPMVVLVWMEPHEPEQVRLSLHLVGHGSYAIGKSMPNTVEMAEVNGQNAIWAEGPYILNMKNGNVENIRLIQGHVLIWEENELTYRLETDLPLNEAIQIAESLR